MKDWIKQNTWVKLHRRIVDWEWYGDGNTFRVFLHLLITANYEDSRYRGHDVPRGSVVIGRSKLAETLGISEMQVRTALTHLKSTNEITIKVTNKFSVATLVKYEEYQMVDDEVTSKTTNNLTNSQPTSNQQVTTSKEYKNKEIKNKEIVNAHARGWKEVFEEVLKSNEGKPMIASYKQMYEVIEKRGAHHLLNLRDAVMSYEEFETLLKYATENNLRMNDYVSEMINKPGLFPDKGRDKKYSLYLTMNSWMRREVKNRKTVNL